MNNLIDSIINSNSDNWGTELDNFVENSSAVFSFPELNEGEKRKEVWKAVSHITENTKDPKTLKNCFAVMRILGREKQALSEMVTDELLELIRHHSGLDDNDHFIFNQDTIPVCVEALKSLCNICFNSSKTANKCCENGILSGLYKRIKHFNNEDIPKEVKFFDMKLLFLLTALCPKSRIELRSNITLLIDVLEFILKEAAENHVQHQDLPPIYLTEEQTDYSCELLKVIFNATVRIDDSDAELVANCFTLTEILRNYLLIPTTDIEKTWMLRNNVINLLTNMPAETYKSLMIPVQEDQRGSKHLEFEGQNMTAIYEILMFTKAKFNEDPTVTRQNEVLSPVITSLLKCTTHRPIRKFLRNQILPPLKDVHTRPEQGSTLRNHMCRMLTTPITNLRDLVAELLFILCKKNVSRMIKYTGYGNAAGLFAQRGLLAGGRDKEADDFSSDSDDSETEEYAEFKHGINPVIGCYEEPHPSAMENMTEEQKEYEAMKLVELMDSLMKTGVIKPCRIGEDGKVHPVKHVLELREGLQNQQVKKICDSDSD